jgi:hypothetical protein
MWLGINYILLRPLDEQPSRAILLGFVKITSNQKDKNVESGAWNTKSNDLKTDEGTVWASIYGCGCIYA